MTFLDMVLVSRMNNSFGVSDKLMVAGGSALADAINQLKYAFSFVGIKIFDIIWFSLS